MQRDRRNTVVVGAFVVAMITALVVWIALISGRTGATDEYTLVYANVTGLASGTKILFEGYPVGLIDEIEPVDIDGARRFRVVAAIRRGWPIPVDSRATIATGIFSAAVIDIRGGRSEELLAPGAEIPAEEAADLVAAVNAAAARLTAILESFEQASEPVLADVDAFIGGLNQAMEQVNAILEPRNVERVSSILANLDQASGDVNDVIAELETTRANLDSLFARLEELIDAESGDVGVVVNDLRHSLAAVARHVDAVAADLETTTRNLNEFSKQIRDDPSRLLRGREAPPDGAP